MRFITTNLCTEQSTSVTSNSEDPNFPASNLKNPLRSKRLRTQLTETTMEVVFDFQTIEDVNSVVLLWPKEDGIKLTENATIKVQANATNVWDTPSVDQTLTVDNNYSVASYYFSTDQSYRYWRVVIEDSGNAWDYIELGTVFIGKSINIENAQNGFKFIIKDNSKVLSTDFGHRYIDEYPQSVRLEFKYDFLEYDSIQVLENAFRTNGTRKPVLVVLDAEENVFDKDHFVVYGNIDSHFSMSHVRYNLFNADSLAIEELS